MDYHIILKCKKNGLEKKLYTLKDSCGREEIVLPPKGTTLIIEDRENPGFSGVYKIKKVYGNSEMRLEPTSPATADYVKFEYTLELKKIK